MPQVAQNNTEIKSIFDMSERLTALIKCSNDNGGYRKAAKLEQKRYLQQCREELGDKLYPYLEMIIEHILIEVCSEPNTTFSNSYKTYGINLRTSDTHSFVEYVLFPEILTKFLMENGNQNSKNASRIMYGERLPTEHHCGLLFKYVNSFV